MASTRFTVHASLDLIEPEFSAAVALAEAFNNRDPKTLAPILADHPTLATQPFYYRRTRHTHGPQPLPHLCVDAKWLAGLRATIAHPSALTVCSQQSGKTVLGHAVTNINLSAIRALLKQGADPCDRAATSLPALALLPAIDPRRGNGEDPVLEPARLLLAAGADPWQAVNYGKEQKPASIVSVVMGWGRLSLIPMLLRHAPIPERWDNADDIGALQSAWLDSLIKHGPEEHLPVVDALIHRELMPPLSALLDHLPSSNPNAHWQTNMGERKTLCAVIDRYLDRFPAAHASSRQLQELHQLPEMSGDPEAARILARLDDRALERGTPMVGATPARMRL